MDDSVPLDLGGGEKKRDSPGLHLGNLKMLLALFIIFMVVVSNFFTDSVLSGFGEKAVKGREPTSWGVVIQGIFVVIMFALTGYLAENGVL